MPTYQYLCLKCQKPFEVFMTFKEKDEKGKPPCPTCSSREVTQVFSGTSFIISRGGNRFPLSCIPSSGCCPG